MKIWPKNVGKSTYDWMVKNSKGKIENVNIEIDTLNQLYIDRIREYRKNPPPEDWDGVFVATSK